MTIYLEEIDKLAIFRDVDYIVGKVTAKFSIPKHCACLIYATATEAYLNELFGQRVCRINAGSCSWKFVPDELDDGMSSNFYSFIFEPDRAIAAMHEMDLSKIEMHAWNAAIIGD